MEANRGLKFLESKNLNLLFKSLFGAFSLAWREKVQRAHQVGTFQLPLLLSAIHLLSRMQSKSVLLLALCAAAMLTGVLAAPAGYIRKESEAHHGSLEWTRAQRSHPSQVIPLQIAIKQSNVDQLLVRAWCSRRAVDAVELLKKDL